MAYRLIPGVGLVDSSTTLLVPGVGIVNKTAAAAGGSTITTATLPAGLGAMGSGQSRSIQPAGLSYMG